jgi:hypothetical protein
MRFGLFRVGFEKAMRFEIGVARSNPKIFCGGAP